MRVCPVAQSSGAECTGRLVGAGARHLALLLPRPGLSLIGRSGQASPSMSLGRMEFSVMIENWREMSAAFALF